MASVGSAQVGFETLLCVRAPPAVDAANYQAATTGAGKSSSQAEWINSERTDCGHVSQFKSSFIQDLMPLLTNYDSMKISINIDQFLYVGKLATLTQLYLELRLFLHDALRAAEADL